MKFQQLPQGARFEYEGQVYTKVGPLTAAAENGRQRMIPRFAVLVPEGGAPVPPAPEPDPLVARARVLAALATCHETGQAWLAQADLTPAQRQGLAECLASARRRVMDDLD